jgi:hypothetical protein
LTAPIGDLVMNLLPNSVDRANKILSFNSAGQPTASLPTTGGFSDDFGTLYGKEVWIDDHGADPNGINDSHPAFVIANDLLKDTGGTIRIGVGKYAFSQECLCDDGVKVVGSGWMEQTGTSPIKGTVCFPLDAHAGTRIFAQKVTAGTSSKGLFFGEMTLSGKKPGGGNILRGIEQENGKYWGYHNLSFQFFDNQAIYISDNGSNVTWMNNIFCRDCVQASGLSGEVGAIHIQGQDNILGPNIEATTSSTSYAEGGKRIALLFDGTAASNIIVGGQYEISEIGIMVRGSGGNKFVGVRSDLNYGNGAEFRVGGNVLAACEFLNNGRNTTNTYDGVTFFAQNNVAAGCNARSTGAVAQVHKYGGRDASGAVGNKIRPFVSTGHGTAATHEDTATGAFSEELIHQELATADDATPD